MNNGGVAACAPERHFYWNLIIPICRYTRELWKFCTRAAAALNHRTLSRLRSMARLIVASHFTHIGKRHKTSLNDASVINYSRPSPSAWFSIAERLLTVLLTDIAGLRRARDMLETLFRSRIRRCRSRIMLESRTGRDRIS
jgi:hypothetical protein